MPCCVGSAGYLDGDLVSRLVSRITSLVRDAELLSRSFTLANRKHFIVIGSWTPKPGADSCLCPFAPQRVFQNREIADCSGGFHSSKTFVGRDRSAKVFSSVSPNHSSFFAKDGRSHASTEGSKQCASHVALVWRSCRFLRRSCQIYSTGVQGIVVQKAAEAR